MAGFLDFTDKLLPNKIINKDLQYPLDLFDLGMGGENRPWILFTRLHPTVEIGPAQAPKSDIVLYMPPNISVQYSAQWRDMSLLVPKIVSGATGAAPEALQKMFGKNRSTKERLSGLGDAVQVGQALLGLPFAEELAATKKQVVNPHEVMAFKNMNFRTFSLSFHMMARNQKEAENIKLIIKEFKLAMHPSITEGSNGFFWKYPDNFKMEFFVPNDTTGTAQKSNGHLFNIKRCALKDMNVSYGGSGIPSFFKDGHPVEVIMTLTFNELKVLTREDIKEGF